MAYTAINKHTDYFNTVLYTGNGSYGKAVTGVGFQPDFVWVKRRDGTADHQLTDAVRGTDKAIESNTTDAERTGVNLLHSFDSDGFTVDDDGSFNSNGNTFASWNWKANGSGSSNTDGDTATTVSVNTTAGFSIVKWTGTSGNTTIGHGLGVAPDMVIAKNTGGSGTNWIVYHKDLSSGYYVKLNLNNAQDNANAYFTSNPTTSILSLTGSTAMNNSGNGMIAYCFASKKGYSRIGNYIGNGDTDGPFVYTGFAPQFVLFKRATGSAGDWQLWDRKRDPYNPTEKAIHPNATGGPSADQDIDLLSNGFKIRSDQGHLNNNTTSFPYLAFGQTLVGTNDIPATAR